MAVLGMESFGHLPDGAVGSADLLSNRWTSVTGNLATIDLTGGRKKIYSTLGGQMVFSLAAPKTTIYVGFRLHNISGSNENEIIEFRDGASVLGLLVKNPITNTIRYVRGTSYLQTTVLQSVGSTSVGSNDFWVMKIIFDNVAGAVEFYKNGALDSSVAGVDTINAGTSCATLSFFVAYVNSQNAFALSDFWINDATNHGEVAVVYRPIYADGSSTDWTPTGDVTNWECVDEVPPDDDTTYNASSTALDLDQLKQTGMDGAVGAVVAVQAHIRARKEAASAGTLKVGLLHSGTHSQSATMGLDLAYQQFSAIFEDVPGGAGWTPAQLDAVEVTYQNIT